MVRGATGDAEGQASSGLELREAKELEAMASLPDLAEAAVVELRTGWVGNGVMSPSATSEDTRAPLKSS